MLVMLWSLKSLKKPSTITTACTIKRKLLIFILALWNSYVNNLNKLVPEGGIPLEELIKTAEGGVFNNAAQVWNHSFYWNVLFFYKFLMYSACVLTAASLKMVP